MLRLQPRAGFLRYHRLRLLRLGLLLRGDGGLCLCRSSSPFAAMAASASAFSRTSTAVPCHQSPASLSSAASACACRAVPAFRADDEAAPRLPSRSKHPAGSTTRVPAATLPLLPPAIRRRACVALWWRHSNTHAPRGRVTDGRRCGISAGPAIGQRKPAPAALAWAAEYRDKFAEPLPAAAAAASVITPSETWLGAT